VRERERERERVRVRVSERWIKGRAKDENIYELVNELKSIAKTFEKERK